ncbi:hypothetical protein SERLA73DRAFT_72093 [Serpula lacrymans var. lacrymans S7.3]|uniref:Thioester reductase (TE) domain-containing protein n=1 Tax=Serpula lacrymans var. lacrymans (strain S7.3) TaxID=936435 RepID=F8PRI5_SERL3|nr:hypothetical protein SERLA73DRAFT_72093 [Serpula lacrymans var. lacrymans S7.3]
MPTPDGLFRAAKATDSDVIFCVLTFIEVWSRSPEYVKWLATRGGVLFGGGPLNQEVGDSLTAAGVSIFNLYGSTEGGIMSTMLPAEVGRDWNYFRFPALVTPEMIPNDDNTFELVMVANEFCRPSVLNTKVGGIDAYSTSDLFKSHPTKSGYWKVYGLTDDQIMHSTGEKTNPGPLENILNQNPLVLSSVIFGRGRFQVGVIVDPKPDYRFDPTDELKLSEFRNKIWPTVEHMNEYAPQRSRLFKEALSKLSKPFTYTAKSTARRQVIISDYDEEISALYDTVEESAQTAIPPPPQWDITMTVVKFIRQIVIAVMSTDVSDDDDIFQRGCDSLQATWIRNSLLRAIRDTTQFDARKFAGNFMYSYPTIATLTTFITNLLSGNDDGGDISHARIVDEMRTMVSKYSQNFLDHCHKGHEASHSAERSGGCMVLLTGSTGALGCYLLVQLISHLDVSRVYALNRKSPNGKTLIQRQEGALLEGGFNSEILQSKKIILCEADLAADCFGLPHASYQEMQGSVTHIIHNAWSVDFNLTLKTFESNIKGLRNLIDFSLSSTLSRPARLLYTSSIGVFQNTDAHGNSVLAEKPIEPEAAIGTGYTESKWLSGGLNGAWNVNEWVPALIQSGSILGLLPDDHKPVSWISLDIAASSLVEFCMSLNLPPDHIVHLVHPHPVHRSSLASVVSSEYSVSLVSYAEWLAALEQKAVILSENVDNKQIPAEAGLPTHLRVQRLLPLFRRLAAKETSSEAMGFDSLDIAEAVALSPTLADPVLPQLGSEDVKGWLAYWRKKGLLPASFS